MVESGKSALEQPRGWVQKTLNWVEVVGNKLPDPAMLFLIALIATWILSVILAQVEFAEIDPRTNEPIRIVNQLSGSALASFLSSMVRVFVTFPPLGVVLVALLGVGVAEHTGYINAGLKGMLNTVHLSVKRACRGTKWVFFHRDAAPVTRRAASGVVVACAFR